MVGLKRNLRCWFAGLDGISGTEAPRQYQEIATPCGLAMTSVLSGVDVEPEKTDVIASREATRQPPTGCFCAKRWLKLNSGNLPRPLGSQWRRFYPLPTANG